MATRLKFRRAVNEKDGSFDLAGGVFPAARLSRGDNDHHDDPKGSARKNVKRQIYDRPGGVRYLAWSKVPRRRRRAEYARQRQGTAGKDPFRYV
jgi:hypothetical protein